MFQFFLFPVWKLLFFFQVRGCKGKCDWHWPGYNQLLCCCYGRKNSQSHWECRRSQNHSIRNCFFKWWGKIGWRTCKETGNASMTLFMEVVFIFIISLLISLMPVGKNKAFPVSRLTMRFPPYFSNWKGIIALKVHLYQRIALLKARRSTIYYPYSSALLWDLIIDS